MAWYGAGPERDFMGGVIAKELATAASEGVWEDRCQTMMWLSRLRVTTCPPFRKPIDMLCSMVASFAAMAPANQGPGWL